MKYLAIKNWRKYQSIDDELGRAPWIKDYVDKDFDPDRMKLTMMEAAFLDRLYRLRARHAHILRNDPAWLIQATGTARRDAAHLPRIVRALTDQKFIFPTDDENFEVSAAVEIEVRKRKEVDVDFKREREETSSLPEKDKVKPYGASDRKAKQEQNQPPLPSAASARKDCGCPDGLCDWSEPITGCAHPVSVGDAIYYQRHIKKNTYFADKLSRGYVLSQWKRLLSDTPEDWTYDPDPMLAEKTIHLDGEDKPLVQKFVTRRPKNAKERALLLKDPDRNREWLFDPACPRGCKKGFLFVSDYPDAVNPVTRRIGQDEMCECVVREEYMEALA